MNFLLIFFWRSTSSITPASCFSNQTVPSQREVHRNRKCFQHFSEDFIPTAPQCCGLVSKRNIWKLKLLGSPLISVGQVRSCYSYQSSRDNRLQVSPLIEWSSIGFFFLLPVGRGSGLSIILNKFWIYQEVGAVIDRADESLDLLRTKKIRISLEIKYSKCRHI